MHEVVAALAQRCLARTCHPFTEGVRNFGEADLAVQQISELKLVDGNEVVGPIPLALQAAAVFSAGRMATTKRIAPSDRLLKYLASPDVVPVLRESGLEQS